MNTNAKFEVTYGDSSLFNKPVKDGFVAARFGETVLTFNSIEDLCGYCVSSGLTPYNVAVRKIVRIPTWTKKDQIAGRYPTVGCLVKEKNTPERCGYECTVIGEHDGKYCLQFDDGSMRFEYLTGIEPVETQKEKAQRLREEWIDKSCYDLIQPTEKAKELVGFIYDGLLSGQLKAPEVSNDRT